MTTENFTSNKRMFQLFNSLSNYTFKRTFKLLWNHKKRSSSITFFVVFKYSIIGVMTLNENRVGWWLSRPEVTTWSWSRLSHPPFFPSYFLNNCSSVRWGLQTLDTKIKMVAFQITHFRKFSCLHGVLLLWCIVWLAPIKSIIIDLWHYFVASRSKSCLDAVRHI